GGTGGATGGTGGATGGTGGATGGTGGATGGTGGATGGTGGTGGSGSQLTSVASISGTHMDHDGNNLYVSWVGAGIGGGVKKVVKSTGAVSDLFTVSGGGCDMVAVNGSNVMAICSSSSTLGKRAVMRGSTAGGAPTEAYVSTTSAVGGLTKDGVFGGVAGPNVYFHDGAVLKKLPAASGAATTLGTWSETTSSSQRWATVGVDGGSYYVIMNYKILSVPVAGGTVVKVADLLEGHTGLIADATNVFFVETYSNLLKVPKVGGTKTKVNTGTVLLNESQLALNTDGTFVYSAGYSGSAHAVMRTPIGGGAPAVVATGTANLKNATLLVDSTTVWALTSTGIFKTPK
ncbi:MAG: hypothetical protein L6Q84_34145, partial [Polyangiaceae bacterium]|nr:hypothetical protein [Polyangiaceae bacterium]